MRIVVTGHTGFIGKYLTLLLQEKGHDVIGWSRSVGKDITQINALEDLENFDVLVHLAARSFIPSSFKEPAAFYHDNIIGTLNCLEACRKKSARMIFLSTYVYGEPQFLPITEEHPVRPTNPYSSSKYFGEQLCQSYYRDFRIPTIIIRPFNIYGKGQSENFLIPTIINQLSQNEIRLQDHRPKRDFLHVLDLIEAIEKALDCEKDFGIYNLGSGHSISVEAIVDILISGGLIKADKVFFNNEHRRNEVLETCADISKAKKELHWEPQKNFAQELLNIALEKVNTIQTTE